MKELQELIQQAREYLKKQGYTILTTANYTSAWNRFARYCKEKEIDEPNKLDAMNFIRHIYPEAMQNKSNAVFHHNAVLRLYDLEENGVFPKCYRTPHYTVPLCYSELCVVYENSLMQRGLNPKTIKSKLISAKKFLTFIADNGITNINGLQQQHVCSYISTIDSETSVAKSAVLFFIRGFMAYIVDNHDADSTLLKLLPVILVNHNESLPSVYSKKEIEKVIGAINEVGKCALRDRAVLMLALQLGIRAGDIRSLRFDSIDWRLKTITFIQEKGKKSLQLPLPDECFFSLLDYLKNERPKCDNPYVFVRSRAPRQPYSSSNAFHYVISECFKRAGIDTNNKHRGLHSLRHSTAVNMLFNDTPYPVISGILGHSNANTTKRYLRMDVNNLRQMSLEVPNVC